MPDLRKPSLLVALGALAFACTPVPAAAQGAPLTAPSLPQATNPTLMPVPKSTTPPQPAAAQPNLPGSPTPPKPSAPIVEQIARPSLIVRKEGEAAPRRHAHRVARHGPWRSYGHRALERPALAGVELVAPLPPPGKPPHIVVPTLDYALDSIATSVTTPLPPIVCHPTRRDPYAPDPHLYREVPVECVPDNP